ncbi:AAA family ATPase [Nonomuraea sp. NPDC048826]|uniref:AAA family ATPase n=1 Tax=Nonomuraea sp. NPDC048826 TaxID=3364347 RepID=UPI00371B9D42
MSAVYLITGIQAAGKSTVAQALAERLPRAAHVRGDAFRRMIVSGGAPMTPDAGDDALRQLRLRYRIAAAAADLYAGEGFTAVVQDVVLGQELELFTRLVTTRPLMVVVLAPDAATVARREAERGKTAYGAWTVAALDEGLRRDTPRIGLWLDTSAQTPAETVEEILARTDEARV